MKQGCFISSLLFAIIIGILLLIQFTVVVPEERKREENKKIEQRGEGVVNNTDNIVNIQFIEFNGHRYLKINNPTQAGYCVVTLEHDPDCPCNIK